MSSIHENVIVAENCIEYKPKNFTTNMSFISQGCISCLSCINGECTKELFKEIEERIRLN